MRLSAFLLALSVVGVIGGAWLVGVWAIGVCVIALSGMLGAYAVLRDVPEKPQRGDQLDLIRRRAS